MNKLTLNAQMTKALTFRPQRSRKNIMPPIRIIADGQLLKDVKFVKYLGYQLDSSLNYDVLVRQLIQKITYKFYLMSKVRPILNMKTALLVYKYKIMSNIDHNLLFYSSFKKATQKKLHTLQNHAIRIILKLPKRTNVDRFHVTLKLWHIEIRHRFFLVKHMDTLAHSKYEAAIDRRQLFSRSHDAAVFTLTPRCFSGYIKSFLYAGRNAWNTLHYDLKSIRTINAFGMNIRSMLKLEEKLPYFAV